MTVLDAKRLRLPVIAPMSPRNLSNCPRVTPGERLARCCKIGVGMTLQTWWIFVCAVFVICGTPGPNMLHIMSASLRHGLQRSTAAMAGCLSAVLLACGASAAGLGAVLVASPVLFDVIKYAGVAYLVYLGWSSWRDKSPPITISETGDMASGNQASFFTLYRRALFVGLSNPKLLIFAAAFFPQFINTKAPQAPQLAVLVVTFSLIEVFWYCVYAMGGRKLAHWLTRATWQRAFNRLIGALFIGFGAALLGYRA